MRVAFAVAACLVWASAAYGQPTQGAGSGGSAMPSANETTLSQSTAATPDDPTAANNDGQASDTNHQIICHTVQNAGSRLSRHATRVCKTREQWEIEQQRNQEIMHRIGATPGQRG